MKLPEDFDFTQSNLKDYLDCPYRFYLKYILHTKWPALLVDDALAFEERSKAGARFHRLIQQYLLGIPQSRLDAIAEIDPNPDLIKWWENFLENVPHLLEGQRYVETSLSTPMLNQWLVAKYDLVLVQDQSQLVIFDWKTSGKRQRKEWLLDRVQTRLYRYILTKAGGSLTGTAEISPEQITMNFWFAPHPEAPISLPYNQKTFQADQTFFENCIQEILDRNEENFFRTDDERKCRYCLYRSHCDRGVNAGDLQGFDAFELDAEDFEFDLDFDQIQEIEF